MCHFVKAFQSNRVRLNERITETCNDRLLLQRLKVWVTETDSYHGQKLFQTVEDEATGSDKRGGMKPLYAHDGVEEIPPPRLWEVV